MYCVCRRIVPKIQNRNTSNHRGVKQCPALQTGLHFERNAHHNLLHALTSGVQENTKDTVPCNFVEAQCYMQDYPCVHNGVMLSCYNIITKEPSNNWMTD